VQLAVHHNAALDVARYEAEAARGLVDQVKALWLPQLRYTFAAIAYDNDLSYEADAFGLATLNVPITGAYNIANALTAAQIISTGGKRTSGLKQAQAFAAIKRLEMQRLHDAVAFDVANYYHLVCLTNDIDGILEDALRRIRVFRQVAAGLNERGSLRASNLDTLQADFFANQLEQLRIAVQAGRNQAYAALRQSIGAAREAPLLLKQAELPPALSPQEIGSAYAKIAQGFLRRPEAEQVDLFARIRGEQTKFAKAAWAPNILFIGNATRIDGNNNTILGAIDGLIASVIIDIPIYDPARRGRLREALGLEYASLAFQRQVEELITLEIEVTVVEAQKALATALRTARLLQTAAEHYDAARQAYSRELVPASAVVTAVAADMLAKIQHQAALFGYHNGRARLKRVTADREGGYGY
jgi:outer membrane protein TolC